MNPQAHEESKRQDHVVGQAPPRKPVPWWRLKAAGFSPTAQGGRCIREWPQPAAMGNGAAAPPRPPFRRRTHRRPRATGEAAQQIDGTLECLLECGIANPLECWSSFTYLLFIAASMSWKPCRSARPCAPGSRWCAAYPERQ